jgi:HlyD family secretion protein
MVLRQSLLWSRAILWIIAGTFAAAFVWACFAPLDEVVHAKGKLEPRGSVRDLQAPVSGVVEETLVREGEAVTAGQLLVKIDPTIVAAEVRSLEQRLASMQAERAFYNGILAGNGSAAVPESIPREIEDLAKNRASFLQENELLRRLRDGIGDLHEIILESGQTPVEGEKDPVLEKLQELKRQASEGLDSTPDLMKLSATETTNLSENYMRLRTQLGEARKIAENRRLSFEAYSRLNESGNLSRVDFLSQQAAYFDAPAVVTEMVAGSELARKSEEFVRRAAPHSGGGPFIVQLAGREPLWIRLGAELAAVTAKIASALGAPAAPIAPPAAPAPM